MLNRSFPIFVVLASFALRGLEADDVRPNILWITVEDMSPRLGCYGDHTVPTPNIDRLASEGVRFTRAFGVYGVCAPNRHCLITGMYPNTTGAMAMRTWKRTAALDKITDPELLAIPTYEATPPHVVRCFPEYLRMKGYFCTNNSKTDYQFRDPITVWDESSNTAHWRDRPDATTPFFSVFNFMTTHESKIFQQTSPIVADPVQVKLPAYYPDTPIVRRDLARHYDNIAAVDGQVGQVLKELDEDGLRDSTIVFFFSDHGDGLPRMKRWVYDSGIRVPLIVRFPDGAGAGTVNEDLVSFVDFAPTVLSLARIPIPGYVQGQAFLGDVRLPPRTYIFASRDRMDPAPETIRAVRDKRFEYVRNYRPDLPYIGYIPYRDQQEIMQEILGLTKAGKLGPKQWQFTSQHKPLEELYDTEADPDEIVNLASDPRYFGKLAELRATHEHWTQEAIDLGHMPETELIKLLWPPDGEQPTTATPTVTVEDKDGKTFASIDCESLGASIAYRFSPDDRWLLYWKPFRVERGQTIYSQANRLGWKHSELATQTVK